jgi:NAD-dependent DNA ligase
VVARLVCEKFTTFDTLLEALVSTDTRYGAELVDLNPIFKTTKFRPFQVVIDAGGTIKGINAKDQVKSSHKQFEDFKQIATTYGANELSWLKLTDKGIKLDEEIERFFSDDDKEGVKQALSLEIGDLALIVADAPSTANAAIGKLRKHFSLSEIDGVGHVIAQNIVIGLESWEVEIGELRNHIRFQEDEPAAGLSGDGLLWGKKVLFTGELSRMKRKDAQELVRTNGGETPNSVVKDLNYLVLGEREHARYGEGWRSSKLKKAEKLIEVGATIEILSEVEFFEKLEAS